LKPQKELKFAIEVKAIIDSWQMYKVQAPKSQLSSTLNIRSIRLVRIVIKRKKWLAEVHV
jgi:hypothetical protein